MRPASVARCVAAQMAPLGDRLMVKPQEVEKATAGGILLTPTSGSKGMQDALVGTGERLECLRPPDDVGMNALHACGKVQHAGWMIWGAGRPRKSSARSSGHAVCRCMADASTLESCPQCWLWARTAILAWPSATAFCSPSTAALVGAWLGGGLQRVHSLRLPAGCLGGNACLPASPVLALQGRAGLTLPALQYLPPHQMWRCPRGRSALWPRNPCWQSCRESKAAKQTQRDRAALRLAVFLAVQQQSRNANVLVNCRR